MAATADDKKAATADDKKAAKAEEVKPEEVKPEEGKPEEAKAEGVETVPMQRNEPVFPGGPTTADVHPDEVQNMVAAGWTRKG